MIPVIGKGKLTSNSTWLRVGVVVGLTLLLFGIGFAAANLPPELVLIAAIVPPVLAMVSSRLEFGALFIIMTAAFVRFSLPTGTASRIVASLLVTGAFLLFWILKMLVKDRRLYLKPSSVNVPLLAFVLCTFVSYLWSNAFRDPLVAVWSSWPFVQLAALVVMVLLPGALLFTANSVSDTRWLKLLCWAMILVGILSLLLGLLRLKADFLNTGGLFSLWFVSLSFAQALFNRRLQLGIRVGLLAVTAAWMYISFVTGATWLSGWLPLMAALAAISLLKSRAVFVILILLLAIYVGLNWDYYAHRLVAAESEESGRTRMVAWEVNWRVTGKHLLFGTGPAGYSAYYMSYFPSEAMATHSNYLDVVAQTGVVGLFFCLWLFGAVAWTGYRLVLRLRGRGDFSEGFAVAVLAGCGGCILAMGLGDWMFPFVYTQTIAGFDYAVYSWVLLGGLVALDNIHMNGGAKEIADG